MRIVDLRPRVSWRKKKDAKGNRPEDYIITEEPRVVAWHIEDGTPLGRDVTQTPRFGRFPWRSMRIGDQIIIHGEDIVKVRAALAAYRHSQFRGDDRGAWRGVARLETPDTEAPYIIAARVDDKAHRKESK